MNPFTLETMVSSRHCLLLRYHQLLQQRNFLLERSGMSREARLLKPGSVSSSFPTGICHHLAKIQIYLLSTFFSHSCMCAHEI